VLCCAGALLGCLLLAATASAAPPANDAFASATTLSGSSLTASGTNVQATKETNEPNHAGDPGGASVWYSWTAPSTGTFLIDTCGSNFDTLLAVYTGSAVGSLTPVISNDEAVNCASESRVAFHATNGVVYRIAVDGWSAGGAQAAPTGTIQLHLQAVVGTPVNDNFASSFTISGTDPVVDGSNTGATKESGEPSHGGNAGGASVWYSWTAPLSGPAYIDTCFSEFDTLLGVYTGSAVNALTLVAGDNDDVSYCGSGGGSAVQFNAVQGTTYRIAVDGSNAAPNAPAIGGFELFVYLAQPPANDNFAAATVLSGSSARATGDNLDATAQAGEPAHAGIGPYFSVWYAWTAPGSGPVTIDTCGSDFDTVLAVYTGNAVNALSPVASNNNSPSCPPRSLVTFTASAGTTYRIAVDGDYDVGDIDLRLNQQQQVLAQDRTPPQSKIRKVIVDSQHGKATVKFGSSEPGGSFRCKLDGKPFRPCHSPKTYRHLHVGRHKVKIEARDAAGNLDTSPAVKTFKIEP
jgi:hypothetical protein